MFVSHRREDDHDRHAPVESGWNRGTESSGFPDTRAEPVAAMKIGAMPTRLAHQFGLVDIVEKALNRHENHRGICGPVSGNMPVSMLSWASNIGGWMQ